MTAESGLDHLPGVEEHFRSSTFISEVIKVSLRTLCVWTDDMS